MGKKSSLKKLGRIAAELPAMQRPQRVGELLSGKELMQNGIDKVNGKPVGSGQYKKVSTVSVKVNHKRQMKRMYNRHGKAGVEAYIDAVDDVIKREKQKAAVDADH